jgi:hypothetical protein
VFVDGGGGFGLRWGCCDCCWVAIFTIGWSDGSRDEGGGGNIGREVVNMIASGPTAYSFRSYRRCASGE